MDEATEQLNKLVNGIVQSVHPQRIILFGSAVRGEMGPDSDFDVLVVMPDGVHRRHTAQHLYGALEGITIPFDLVVATSSDLEKHHHNPGLIYQTVLREGKTLYVA